VRAHEVGILRREPVRAPLHASQSQGAFGRVDVDGAPRSAGERGNGKGPRIRKQVEHGPFARAGAKAGAVVPLVQVEAGLLARGHVGGKAKSILEESGGERGRIPRSRSEPVSRTIKRSGANVSRAAVSSSARQRVVPSVRRSITATSANTSTRTPGQKSPSEFTARKPVVPGGRRSARRRRAASNLSRKSAPSGPRASKVHRRATIWDLGDQ